jgi:hypothetical protein
MPKITFSKFETEEHTDIETLRESQRKGSEGLGMNEYDMATSLSHFGHQPHITGDAGVPITDEYPGDEKVENEADGDCPICGK